MLFRSNNIVVILRPPLVRGYERMTKRERDWLDSGIIYQFTFSKTLVVSLTHVFYRMLVSMIPSMPGR